MTESSLKLQMQQPDEFVPIDVPEDASQSWIWSKQPVVVGMGGAGFPTGVKLNINLSQRLRWERLDPEINPELPKDFSTRAVDIS